MNNKSSPSKTIINHQKLPERSFPTASTFSIDIDPFSSSSSTSSVASFKVDLINETYLPVRDNCDPFQTNKTQFDDPFETQLEPKKDLVISDPFSDNKKPKDNDPFSVFDTISNSSNKEINTMSLKIDDIPPLDFNNVEELNGSTAYDEPQESGDHFESPKEIKELETEPENTVEDNEADKNKPEEVKEEITELEKIVEEEKVSETKYESDQESDSPTKFDIKVDSDEDDELKDEGKSMNSTIHKTNSALFDKKHSYDTIMSLDLQGGSRKNTNESEESDEDLSKRFNFTLEGAVEDETNDDVVEQVQDESKQSITKVIEAEVNELKEEENDSKSSEQRSTLSTETEGKKSFVQIKTVMVKFIGNTFFFYLGK